MTLRYITGNSCPTCHAMLPIVRQVTSDMGVPLMEVSVDDMSRREVEYYNVNSLPTLVIEDEDCIMDIRYGRMGVQDLRSWMGDFQR